MFTRLHENKFTKHFKIHKTCLTNPTLLKKMESSISTIFFIWLVFFVSATSGPAINYYISIPRTEVQPRNFRECFVTGLDFF